MTEKVLKTQEAETYYRITGTGMPVVLIHGFGYDGRIWDDLVNDLDDHFLFIIPDLPGSGKSLLKTEDCSMESLADVIKSIIDNENITVATMIGHSMGGYILMAFAEKYERHVKGLGLFHSFAFPDSEERKTVRTRGIQFIEDHGQLKFLEQSTPNLFSNGFKESHPETIRDLIAQYTNFQDGALVHYYQAMMQRPDRTHILKKYPDPVLFILGEFDTAIPLADGLRQSHLPRLCYIHILKNSGHMGMIEETGKCREILHNFLHDLSRGLPVS